MARRPPRNPPQGSAAPEEPSEQRPTPPPRTQHPTDPKPARGAAPYRPRATKAEANYRLHALLALIKQGFGPQELQAFAMEKFHLSPRRAWEVVNETFDLLLASYSALDYQRLAAVVISRYDHIYRRAALANDLPSMLHATDSVARHFMAPVKEFEAAAPPPQQSAGAVDDPEEEF